MSRYQLNDVYNTATNFRFKRRRNATLKSSIAYIDARYPDLIFLIPKYTSKKWARDGMCTDDEILASVYMKRNGEEGTTWIMDLEIGTQLNLKKRVNNTSSANNHLERSRKKNYDADVEEEFAAKASRNQTGSGQEIPLEVLVTIQTIEDAKGGRKADIVLTQSV